MKEIFIFIIINFLTEVSGSLGPEGCENGWVHYKSYCYNFNDGRVHFDAARAICIWKRASVLSLWKPDEISFIVEHVYKLNNKPSSTWLGLIPTKNNRWMWLDGSFFDLSKKDVPPSRSGICGAFTTEKKLQFMNCEHTVPTFVCKKPLTMLYIPSTMNVTTEGINDVQSSQADVIFERLWPPLLDKVSLEKSSEFFMATIDVDHETDCAYRCYTLDGCKTFKISCKSQRKCNTFVCELLSGLQ